MGSIDLAAWNARAHKAGDTGPSSPFHSVVVIGAGVAGLQAARLLQPHFPDLLLLEASDRLGGRVKQVEGVVPWPVELGPEFIHGANSSLKAVLAEIGCEVREYAWPDRWYYGREKRMAGSNEQDPELEAVHEKFAAVGREPAPPARPDADISAEAWLRSRGASDRMVAIADACYANDFGCSIRQLGLREMITENRRWDSGETYLVLDRSLSAVVGHLARDLRHVRQNWPVTRIDHARAGAVVWGPGNAQVRCRHVVVTVPLSVLQRGGLIFIPPLPREQQAALSRIKMSNAVKVILGFGKPFWPEDFFDVVCPDCFIPEFWVTSYPEAAAARPSSSPIHPPGLADLPASPASASARAVEAQSHEPPSSSGSPAGRCCMVGFAAGERVEAMSGMAEDEIVRRALAQLDEMFGSPEQPRPASVALASAHVADWSREPHVQGAYSYPSLGAMPCDRELLAASLGSTVFFAGEATHPAVNPCLQAAMETGERAAGQVLAAAAQNLQRHASRL